MQAAELTTILKTLQKTQEENIAKAQEMSTLLVIHTQPSSSAPRDVNLRSTVLHIQSIMSHITISTSTLDELLEREMEEMDTHCDRAGSVNNVKEVKNKNREPERNPYVLRSSPRSTDTLNNVRRCLLIQHCVQFEETMEQLIGLTAGADGAIECLHNQLLATATMLRLVCANIQNENKIIFEKRSPPYRY